MKIPEMKVSLLIVIVSLLIMVLMFSGIPQDAYKAYRKTHRGDRWRMFRYYQTARWEGVPAALDRYGVEPESDN